MAKIFRKIRQQLLTENKIVKYLLYAAGEMFLVIMGILIALNLSQKSQHKETEAKVETIFETIQEDLLADIKEAESLYYGLRRIDTLSYLVLNEKLKAENYQEPLISFIRLIVDLNLFNFNNQGFDNLSQNLSIVPTKYNPVVKKLEYYYNSIQESVEYWNNEVARQSKRNSDYLVENLEAYSKREIKANEINNLFANFQYRNSVKLYAETNSMWLHHIWRYRTGAIDSYQKISKLLNKPIVHEGFEVKDSIAELFIGEWKDVGDPDAPNYKYTTKNSRLYIYESKRPEIQIELDILDSRIDDSKTIVDFLYVNIFMKGIFENDTLTYLTNDTIQKWIKVKNIESPGLN